MLSAIILGTVLVAAAMLLSPRVARHRVWRAATTPLASIIGSGFLVLGPILDASYGVWAPLVMAILCLTGWLFGAAIRFNIAVIAATRGPRGHWEERLESLASLTLSFAYVVSVAYYLNLFGAFGVSLTEVNDSLHARLLTTSIYLIILLIGWTHGFSALERTEQVSVGAKLAIIAGLLVGLAAYFGQQAVAGELVFNPPQVTGWPATTLAMGLIVTIQGFETSRYLGDTYDVDTRLRSMRLAQAVASAIYLLYVLLMAYVFSRGQLGLTETAIIDLMRIVAPVLPVLLVAAALTAQFSAAVADTSGAGGLMAELSGDRLAPRMVYALLAAVGLLLTWTLDVFQIIAYASRAFALYYAIQSAIAAMSMQRRSPGHWRVFALWMLAALGLAIAALGADVEKQE